MVWKSLRDDKKTLPHLLVSRSEAAQKIQAQIEQGAALKGKSITSDEELDQARDDFEQWNRFSVGLLKTLFDNDAFAAEYAEAESIGVLSMGPQPTHVLVSDLKNKLNVKITALRSIDQRLASILEPEKTSPGQGPGSPVSKDIVIIHGQDGTIQVRLAQFIRKLGLNPVAIDKDSDSLWDLIVNQEQHPCGFVIVVLAPESAEGLKKAPHDLIFALGYFLGKRGREKVCALYSKTFPLPDVRFGAELIPFEEEGVWKLQVAKALQQAHCAVDLEAVMKASSS